jgi:RNA polymerase sigma factor (sigma-70 family)
MLKAGARGYVVKDSVIAELVQAIEVVVSGGMYLSPGVTDIVMNNLLQGDEERASSPFDKLTPRERETLQLLVEGTPVKDIADLLNVSAKTVETHRHNIMQKLGVESLPELTKLAIREGLTTL